MQTIFNCVVSLFKKTRFDSDSFGKKLSSNYPKPIFPIFVCFNYQLLVPRTGKTICLLSRPGDVMAEWRQPGTRRGPNLIRLEQANDRYFRVSFPGNWWRDSVVGIFYTPTVPPPPPPPPLPFVEVRWLSNHLAVEFTKVQTSQKPGAYSGHHFFFHILIFVFLFCTFAIWSPSTRHTLFKIVIQHSYRGPPTRTLTEESEREVTYRSSRFTDILVANKKLLNIVDWSINREMIYEKRRLID